MQIVQLFETYFLLESLVKIPSVSTFVRDTFFPNRIYSPQENVMVDFRKLSRIMAPLVPEDAGHTIVQRQNFQTQVYNTPFIAPTRQLSVKDLRDRLPGDTPFTVKTPVQRAAELITLDMVELDKLITRREEWMAVQAILTGQIPLVWKDPNSGNTLTQLIDYTGGGQRPGVNTVTLGASAKWDQTTSNPLGDLLTFYFLTLKVSALAPNILILDPVAWNLFYLNANVEKVFYSFRGDSGNEIGVVKPEVMNSAVTYAGRLRYPPLDVYVYNEWYVQDNSTTETTMFPARTAVIGSTESRNSVFYGAVTQLEGDGQGGSAEFTYADVPRVPKVWGDIDHDRRWMRLASRPLPVPTDLREWTILNV